jgi:sugar lactone lactonase YvrE
MKRVLRTGLSCLFLLQLGVIGFSQTGSMNTVAGNGTRGFNGDGGPATSAELYSPYGVAIDASGNLFIADVGNARIRKVTQAGIISTIAGYGAYGFSGDGGLATSAALDYPMSVAVSPSGNLFIADAANNRIRKVTTDGVINTLAGNGSSGIGGDGGPATSARLNYPTGVAVDSSGNLYVADTLNYRIRKVTSDGMIRTLAGNGSIGFSGDGGPAASARLNYPTGVAADLFGNLYFADTLNYCIRKVTPAGFINTVAGNGTSGFSGDGGPATSAELDYPVGVAIDSSGNLFIADSDGHRIRRVTPDGIIHTIAGNGNSGFSGDGGPAASAMVNSPTGVAIDASGNLYISDAGNARIRQVIAAVPLNTYFPQVVIGGSWSTSFSLSNTGSSAVSGNLNLTDNQGGPLTVNSPTLGVGSSFPISVPVGGTLFLTANQVNSNDPQIVGWAAVETYGGSVNGVAAYQSISQGIVQTATGVLSSQSTQFATIPVNENDSQNLKTAFAIANPADQSLAVKVALVDANGSVVDDTVSMTLNPGQQIARYFNQIYSNRPTFQGSMVFRAQGGGTFTIIALVQNQQFFTAIPVIPGKAANIPN